MAVTELSHSYFMVWTPHGYIIGPSLTILTDGILKLELESYDNNYYWYLKTLFSDEFKKPIKTAIFIATHHKTHYF